MRIAIATGTRADWGLLKPLADTLRSAGADIFVIALHQHLIPEMGNTISEITADGYTPAARIPASGSPAEIMARAAQGISEILPSLYPDIIIILGDRCEMLGVASAALLCGFPIAHIAGGTISEGAFDDSVRHAITKMATLHFPETGLCASRIIQMGEDEQNVVTSGALGVFNALNLPLLSRSELEKRLGGFPLDNPFMVVTLHAATLGEGAPLQLQQNMTGALMEFIPDMQFLITYPNSDVDPTPLIADLHAFEKRFPRNVKVVPSLGRLGYLSAVALSCGVVGNSSSALVEVPSLGVPSLDIGIRQSGREHGPSVYHCGSGLKDISEGLHKILSPSAQKEAGMKINPYFLPDTPGIITRKILSTHLTRFPQKHFHSRPSTLDSRPSTLDSKL